MRNGAAVPVLLVVPLFFALGIPRAAVRAQSELPQVLQIDLDLVLIHATVTDGGDQPVTDLGPEDFRVFEDSVEQDIRYLSMEQVPVSIGIVFDISSSMAEKLPSARDAAVLFLKNGSPDDEYFLVEFKDAPQVSQEFTRDIGRLQNRLILGGGAGMTALYDAVYLGLEKARYGTHPKRALLLITDGEDNRSRYSHSQVRRFLRESDVQIYAIGLLDSRPRPQPRGRGPAPRVSVGRRAIQSMAEETGGRAFFPNSVRDLEDIVRQINTELKNQYVIGYVSSNTTHDGGWRDVRVRIEPPAGVSDLNVRSRRGYYAAAR